MTAGASHLLGGSASRPNEPPALHTAEEAARLLKVKQSWLERQAAARKVPFAMLGGSYRFTDEHLAEIVRINEVTPAQPADRAQRQSPARDRGRRDAIQAADGFERLRPRPRTVRQY